MLKIDKGMLVVFGLLAAVALFFPLALPTFFRVDETLDPRFSRIPMQIDVWTGKDEPVDELTYQILETKNVLSRLYTNDKGETIHLLLVGSNKDRRVAHPPEVCFTSSHYMILKSMDEEIDIAGEKVPIRKFIAQDTRNPKDLQQVVYLYKVGDRYTINYYSQQLQFAWDTLTRQEGQILLVRLSGATQESFQGFLAEILSRI